MKTWLGIAAAGLALLLAVVVAYSPVREAGFIWDDDAYVERNKTLRDSEGLADIWLRPTATPQYYPLVHTSYWIEYHYSGLDPLTYHVTNLVLHALAALLLWRLLKRLKVPGAFFAAVLFALHPVHVESVAWITERKNVLSGVFYFATFLAWWRFRADDEGRLFEGSRRRWSWYALALPLFAAALLSKSVTCTLPCVAWLVLWWKTGRISKRDWLQLFPFLWIGAVQGLLTARLEATHVLAVGPEWDFSVGDRFIIAGRAIWFYLQKLAWPDPLIFSYPRWTLDTSSALQWAAPVLVALTALCLWLGRKTIGRGPLVAWLAFGGTLFPALGFVNVYPMRYSFVADHFQYLASVPIFVLFAAGLANLLSRGKAQASGESTTGRRIVYALILVSLAFVLGRITYEQSKIYESREVLWRDTLAKNPGSGMANNNLGILLFRRGDYEEALHHFREALSFKQNIPEMHAHIAMSLNRLARFDEAEAEILKGLKLKPEAAFIREIHARIMLASGRQREALTRVEEAIAADEKYGMAWATKGAVLYNLDRKAEALRSFDRAIELDPDAAPAWNGRGLLLSSLNDDEGALQAFQRAAEISPASREIALNLAQSYGKNDRIDEALELLSRFERRGPFAAERILLEANLRLKKGEAAAAINLFAVVSRPEIPAPQRLAAWRGLVLSYSAAARHDEARAGAARLRKSVPTIDSWVVTAKVEKAANNDKAAAQAYRQAAAMARGEGRLADADEYEAEAAALSRD